MTNESGMEYGGHYDSARSKDDLLQWAVSRWRDEVASRPIENINRKTLDETWRQVIRKCGGNDVMLLKEPPQ